MGGIFDSIFDFNRDGKTDLSEQFIAFMMMQEMLDEEEESGDEEDFGDGL